MKLTLYNTLKREKQAFKPLDPANVCLYVCGITPYDHAHIGHARVYVVFDVLYRLLRELYGENHVTYVRNFTDVDDKIINRAHEKGVEPGVLSEQVIASYHEDMQALNVLSPTHEPKVTTHIGEIQKLITQLLAKGIAYITASGDVNYNVAKAPQRDDYTYGNLSRKKLEDLVAGARVDVNADKINPGDFALWKAAKPGEPQWDVPAEWAAKGAKAGRPGWHIECSAMSGKYLGNTFDIHGGGEDLQFPHHENEIAQSEGAHDCKYVNYWMHNAFITVGGEKMSKSLGNFVTIKDALKDFSGEAIRLWILQTHYRKPVDYSYEALAAAQKRIDRLYRLWSNTFDIAKTQDEDVFVPENEVYQAFMAALCDDLNTSEALAVMEAQAQALATALEARDESAIRSERPLLAAMFNALGVVQLSPEVYRHQRNAGVDEAWVEQFIAQRAEAKQAKNFAEADRIRDELKAKGIILEDSATGTTWRRA